MDNADQTFKKLFCWTSCAYRKPDFSEDEYRDHMTDIYMPLMRGLIMKYGITRYTMVRNLSVPYYQRLTILITKIFTQQTQNASTSKSLMNKITTGTDLHVKDLADYDYVITAHFPDYDSFVRMKEDRYFKEKVQPDYESFTDMTRSKYVAIHKIWGI
ncbi:MAG: hypothetical protein Q9160_007714 [Pyrenula sp. 1 TL-2023]